MKKLKSREEFLNEGHSYDNEIEKARMMQGSASELVEWAARKVAESKPENFKEGVISPIQEAKESYKIMRFVNGRTKELIEGTIGEIMDQFSSAMDKLRDSGSGKQYKDDPKTIEELVKYLNAAQSYIDKGKSKITYEIKESVNEGYNLSNNEISVLERMIMMIKKGDNLSTNQNINKVAIPLLRKIIRGEDPINDGNERKKLIDKMNVIRKKLKLKPLTNESVDEAAKDMRFKYVISKDFKNHGVVDFIKGDKLYIEIDADGNTVPYSSSDVYVLNDEDTDTLQKAMMKGKLKPDSSPKELESFMKKHLSDANESVNEAKLNTGNIYELPNGHIVKITSGQNDSSYIYYTAFDPESGKTYKEDQPYDKMIKTVSKWKVVRESVNEVGKGSNWAEKYVNDTNLYKKLNWYMKMGKGVEKKIKGKEFVIMSDGSALIWNTKTSDWELYKPKRIDKKTGKPIYESEVNEADDKWSDDVKTKWTPPAGLFTEPANKIADVLHKESDDLDQAMSRLQFYINRGGKLLDGKAKANLETAKKLLQQKYD